DFVAPLAQASIRFVDDDARQPSEYARLAPELRQTSEGADISFLHHVLGFRFVAHNAACDPEEPLVAPLHDGPESAALARPRATHQIELCHGCICGTCDVLGGQCSLLGYTLSDAPDATRFPAAQPSARRNRSSTSCRGEASV